MTPSSPASILGIANRPRKIPVMSNAHPRLRLAAGDDLRFSLLTEHQTHGEASLSAGDVEMLIRTLSEMRERMTPEVPRQLPSGPMSGPHDPIWAVPGHPKAPDKLLTIRHPGIGWLPFFLPAAEAQKLGRALLSGQTRNSDQRSEGKSLN
jgi:hypothetical protein